MLARAFIVNQQGVFVEEDKAGRQRRALVTVDEGMIAAQIEQVRGRNFDTIFQ